MRVWIRARIFGRVGLVSRQRWCWWRVGVAAGVTSGVGLGFGLGLVGVWIGAGGGLGLQVGLSQGSDWTKVRLFICFYICLCLISCFCFVSFSFFIFSMFPLGHFHSFQVSLVSFSFFHIQSPAGTVRSTCKCTFHSPGPGNSDQEACGVRTDVPGCSGVDGHHRSWSVPACAPAPSSGMNWMSYQWPSGQGRRRR